MDAEGNVTAVSVGEADITVSAVIAKKEMSSTCHVTVAAPETEEDNSVNLVTTGYAVAGTVAIEAAGMKIPETVSVEELTWRSGDEEVATIDENGVIAIVGPGTCTISVTGAKEDGWNGPQNAASAFSLLSKISRMRVAAVTMAMGQIPKL